jgi:hypothetical protein
MEEERRQVNILGKLAIYKTWNFSEIFLSPFVKIIGSDRSSSYSRPTAKRSRSKSITPDVKLSQNLRLKCERDIKELQRKAEKEYEIYKAEPEAHAEYRERWAQFWNVRSIQLESVGISPNKFDLTEEWRSYFSKFLKVNLNKQLEEIENTTCRRYKFEEKRLQDEAAANRAKRMRRSRSSSRSNFRGHTRSAERTRHHHHRSRSRTRRTMSRSRSRSKHHHHHRSSSREKNRNSPRKLNYYTPKQHQKMNFHPKNNNSNIKFRYISPAARKNFGKVTVISLCYDLLSVPDVRKLYQKVISDVLTAALNAEKKSNKEYCMTRDEFNTLEQIKGKLLNLLIAKHFPYFEVTTVKELRQKIDVLLNRWTVFTQYSLKDKKVTSTCFYCTKVSQQISLSIGEATPIQTNCRLLK